MVLQYSNQETSVTIGESVRDEDGNYQNPFFPCIKSSPALHHLYYNLALGLSDL